MDRSVSWKILAIRDKQDYLSNFKRKSQYFAPFIIVCVRSNLISELFPLQKSASRLQLSK